MAVPLTVPVGELTTLGAAKEASQFTFQTPTIFPRATNFEPKPKNLTIKRNGAAKQYGQTLPGLGAFQGEASLDFESQLDILGPFLAWALGSQSTPSTSVVNTTAATAATLGASSMTLTSGDCVVPGMKLVSGTNNCTVTSVSAATPNSGGNVIVTFTPNLTAAVTQGAAVTCTATGAYLSTMKMGALPTFSLQQNRITDAVDYIGCIIDSMTMTIDRNGLGVKFAVPYQWETEDAAPTAPSYSTKGIALFDHPGNIQFLNGAVVGDPGQVSTLSAQITLNNNIDKNYYSGGGGRKVQNWVQQQRSVKASVKLGFETADAYKMFLQGGNATLTGAQAPADGSKVFTGIPFSWQICAADIIDATNGVPYLVVLKLPNLFPTGHAVPNKSTGLLEQTFETEAAGSGAGNNDDLTILYVGSSSTVF